MTQAKEETCHIKTGNPRIGPGDIAHIDNDGYVVITARKKDMILVGGYKRPRQIQFRDEIPISNVGKVLRRVLRDEELWGQTGS